MATGRALAGICIAVVLSICHGAFAAEQSTEITSLAAAVSGRSINITGLASFGGEERVVLADDPTEAVGRFGLDITKLYASRPSPASNEIEFVVAVSNLDDGVPEFVQYNWDISVDGGEAAGGSNWSIKTMRQQTRTGTMEPYAAVFACIPGDAGYSCSERARLDVAFDSAANEIRLTVPLAAIGAKPGSVIRGWDRSGEPVWARSSAAGVLTGGVTFDGATPDDYTVANASVSLGLATADTPLEQVVFTKAAPVASDGSFAATLSAPGSGTYHVWAKACFGVTCDSASVIAQVT